jgi:hypothetical protein
MTGDSRRLADYLAHIAEAIERIDRYTCDLDEPALPTLGFSLRDSYAASTSSS